MRKKERGNDSEVLVPNHLPPAIVNENRAFFPIFKMNFHTSYSQSTADNFFQESVDIEQRIKQRRKRISISHLEKRLKQSEVQINEV